MVGTPCVCESCKESWCQVIMYYIIKFVSMLIEGGEHFCVKDRMHHISWSSLGTWKVRCKGREGKGAKRRERTQWKTPMLLLIDDVTFLADSERS